MKIDLTRRRFLFNLAAAPLVVPVVTHFVMPKLISTAEYVGVTDGGVILEFTPPLNGCTFAEMWASLVWEQARKSSFFFQPGNEEFLAELRDEL